MMRSAIARCFSCRTCKYVVSMAVLMSACHWAMAGTPQAETGKFRFKTACGPIGAFVALQQLGQHATLEGVARDLKWTEGSLTSLRSIRDVLNDVPGIRCEAVRLSPAQLSEIVNRDQGAVILAIRKGSDSINHAVCVRQVAPKYIEYVDYPELAVRVQTALISDVWDGQALVVRRDAWDPTTVSLLALDAVALTLACTWLASRLPSPSADQA